jgi:LAO/AO transport system kinase
MPEPNQNVNLWIPPIQKTVSTEGKGIPELVAAIARHVEHLRSSGDWTLRERTRLEVELEALIRDALMTRFHEDVPASQYEDVLEKVVQRNISPWEAVRMLLNGRLK